MGFLLCRVSFNLVITAQPDTLHIPKTEKQKKRLYRRFTEEKTVNFQKGQMIFL